MKKVTPVSRFRFHQFTRWTACFLFILFFQSAFAHQYGTLSGTILDAKTGKEISFANIIIEKSLIGTTSDLHGKFQIRGIEAGDYVLVVSHLGYKTFKKNIRIRNRQTTTLLIKMQPTSFNMSDLNITARRPFSIASSQAIRSIDLQLRPVKSSQDLLKLVPGLIIAQHAGGGKAEQIFLRGFDCDHGTDVNISVDGIPVNMVSHAHGQGYADLHFLIPELVGKLSVYKGPYFAQFGDFATAGAIAFTTKDILKSNSFHLEVGQFNTLKTTLLLQTGKGNAMQNGIFAAQYYTTDGPFDNPQDLKRLNVFGKYFINLNRVSRLTFKVNAFNSAWNASGQIPDRVVKAGIIDRFGALDPMEGGTTTRQDFSIVYRHKQDDHQFRLQTYLTRYVFKLFSDFTYYLQDTVNGDMIEQNENRWLSGMKATYQIHKKINNIIVLPVFGAGFRNDAIQTALWHSPNRIRMNALSNATINQTNLFVWAQSKIIFNIHWRIEVGLRGDYITYDVDDHLGNANDTLSNGLPHASGYAQQAMLNPKFNVVYSPSAQVDIYLNAGTGFHSNDARNVIFTQKAKEIEQVKLREGYSEQEISEWLIKHNFDPQQQFTGTMPRAYGAETGLRAELFRKLNIGIALWYMYLDKEFVYAGDGGYSELSNPTQRMGLDFEGRLKLTPWLWADADLTLSRGRINDLPEGKNYIPLAPNFTLTGGLTMMNFHGFDVSLRTIHIGSRPANEDNTVRALGYTLVNFGASYHLKKYTFSVTIENLLNTEWNEAQFDTESRMKWEKKPVDELHYTPGNPFNVRCGIGIRF
ncbi:TonB-dependent receptor [Candidatus Sulfidibacterium hydrothermale]|uniref:TonB-dependent receptor n=1 Tax=Candidatus Sulfidibacterium hydrothermale TaxID=2875962 RepID=UPI001F0AD10B|nr:TonB-dependent receptor [Candidatus Sulfidibacterium hydrothermale]UBM63213.1 TonB-dependent receptor [Candidatus Sulfidibacterium hydrothermale]